MPINTIHNNNAHEYAYACACAITNAAVYLLNPPISLSLSLPFTCLAHQILTKHDILFVYTLNKVYDTYKYMYLMNHTETANLRASNSDWCFHYIPCSTYTHELTRISWFFLWTALLPSMHSFVDFAANHQSEAFYTTRTVPCRQTTIRQHGRWKLTIAWQQTNNNKYSYSAHRCRTNTQNLLLYTHINK